MAGGRPSKYKPELHLKLAREFGKLGKTNEELAELFEVNPDTIYTWRKEHPEFSEALKSRSHADGNVERSLYEMATGYTYTTEEVVNGEVVLVTKTIPPNATAMIFWLKNRRPKDWRDKQEMEVSASMEIKHTFDPEGI